MIRQLKRTPTLTGFESGWTKFSIVSVHLHPGDDDDDQALRKEEVRLLLDLLKEKKEALPVEYRNVIILGDTNLYKDDTDIVQLFSDDHFFECGSLKGKFTNTSLNQVYDRIFLNVHNFFNLAKDENDNDRGGVFNLFKYVYQDTEDEIAKYHDFMRDHKADNSNLTSPAAFKDYFNKYWKRNQMSDHLPVWIEILTDSSESFLSFKKKRF